MRITFTVTRLPSCKGPSIWDNLAARLGREPTNAEGAAEVKRLLAKFAEERESRK